jgi:hypothetical protein
MERNVAFIWVDTTKEPKGDHVYMKKRICYFFDLRYKRIPLSTLWEDIQKVMFPVSSMHSTITNINKKKWTCSRFVHNFFLWWRAPQQMLRTHRSLEAYCATLWWRWLVFSFFRVMEHMWNETDRGKPKYSGQKPVPVPLCPPQIPHGLTRDWTRASAVGGRRLTAWAMARPQFAHITITYYYYLLHI